MSQPPGPIFIAHGIQLNYLGVKELSFKSTRHPRNISAEQVGEAELTTGLSSFDKEANEVNVMVRFESTGRDGAYNLKVELVAEFRVDTEKFPAHQVEQWAAQGAPFILMPFLREHVYSLSARVELIPIFVPLFVVPTFKVENASQEEAVDQPASATADA